MAEKYQQAFVREVFGTNAKGKKVRKFWQLVLKYKEPNPSFVEKPVEGEDNRTSTQKRREVWKQVTKVSHARSKTNATRELQEWRDEMESKAQKPELPNASMTVGEYVTKYIDTIEAAGTVRPSAISDYRTSAKRINEGVGEVILRDLTPAMIQAWEARLLKGGKSVNTVLKYHRLLNSVCKHAINVRDLDWNPCTAVKKPKRVAPSPNSLDANQYARLYTTLDAMEATPIVTAASIAMFTGMREGEVCGLKWKCYDEKAGIIQVEKAIAKAGGKKYVTEPKTDASKRNIPVHPKLAEMLERRRETMFAELEVIGVRLKPAQFGELYVVGAVNGKYYDPTLLSRAWKLMADSYGLTGTQGRRITFHDLRHSFATRAIADGADVKAVAAVLGHTDARVTLNVYADADRESKRNAVSRAGDGIESQGKVKPYARRDEEKERQLMASSAAVTVTSRATAL